MTPSWTEVNAAVMAVLGEVARPRERPVARASKPDRDVFVDRLFSLRHAEAVGDVEEVRLLSGTVVTPLARDLLKRKQIKVRYVSKAEARVTRVSQQGEWGFAIESKNRAIEPIRRLLLEDWLEVGDDPVEAARWVVEAEGRGALVVTDEASVASWLAGRVEGIRSATVFDPEAVSRAVEHLGVNLIVVEPLGKSIYQLKQIGERFRSAGAPILPDWLVKSEATR
jgi:hypothetical protein